MVLLKSDRLSGVLKGEMRKKTAVIAMSGGVDSSVAAALLQKDGFEVIGVTMEIFDGSTTYPEGNHHACFGPGEQQDIEDAEEVAQKLGIPYHTVNLKQEYKTSILDYFVNEYTRGKTPNPCVKCNHEMKFGAIGRELAKRGIQYDYFATGHYARVGFDSLEQKYVLKKAIDQHKDQTYFLFNLKREQLQNTLFPLGSLRKEEVREIARDLVPTVSEKKESQDFVAGGYSQLFQNTDSSGPILNQAGETIGEHKGVEYFTIGQRKGLGISAQEPLYVTSKDPGSKAVTVGNKNELMGKGLIANQLNWLIYENLHQPVRLKVKIRFQHDAVDATVSPLADGEIKVEFDEPQFAIAPGQAVVFYKDDIVAGGGMISNEVK